MKSKPIAVLHYRIFSFRSKQLMMASFLIVNLFSGVAFSAPKDVFAADTPLYKPRVDIAGYQFFNGSGTTGLVDALLPLRQDPSNLFYGNFRTTTQFAKPFETDMGLGFRHLSSDEMSLLGGYLFYDRRETSHSKIFNQITAGGEYWYNHTYMGFTAYVPVGRSENNLSENGVTTVDVGENRRHVLIGGGEFEKVMTGFDVEVGYEPLPGLITYIGGYDFFAAGVHSAPGPRARVEYDFKTLLGDFTHNDGLFLDKLVIESEIRHDDLRGTEVFAGLRTRIRFGDEHGYSAPHYWGVADKMTSLARHDINLAPTAIRHIPGMLVSNDRGDPLLIADAYNEGQLSQATQVDENVDVIAVHDTFDVSGEVNIRDKQVLTGGDYNFNINHVNYTAYLSDGAVLNTGQGLGLGANNSVRDITINSAGSLSVQSTDNRIGHTTLNNVTTNAGMQFVSEHEDNPYLMIDNSDLTLQGDALVGVQVEGNHVDLNLNNSIISMAGDNNNGILAQSNWVHLANSHVDVVGAQAIGVQADMASIENENTISAIGENAIGVKGDITINNGTIIGAGNSKYSANEGVIQAVGASAIGVNGTVMTNNGIIRGEAGATGADTVISNHGIIIGHHAGTGVKTIAMNQADSQVIGDTEGGLGAERIRSNLGMISGVNGGIGANTVVRNERGGLISGNSTGSLGAGVVSANLGNIFGKDEGAGTNTVNINEKSGQISGFGVDSLGVIDTVTTNFGNILGVNGGIGAQTVMTNEMSGFVAGLNSGSSGANTIDTNFGRVIGMDGGTGTQYMTTNETGSQVIGDGVASFGATLVESNFGSVVGKAGGTGISTLEINATSGQIIGDGAMSLGAGSIKSNLGSIRGLNYGIGVDEIALNLGTIEGRMSGTGAGSVSLNLSSIQGEDSGTGANFIETNNNTIKGYGGGIGAGTVMTNNLGAIIEGQMGGKGAQAVMTNMGHINGDGVSSLGADNVISNLGSILGINAGTGAGTVEINESIGGILGDGAGSLGTDSVVSNQGVIRGVNGGIGVTTTP